MNDARNFRYDKTRQAPPPGLMPITPMEPPKNLQPIVQAPPEKTSEVVSRLPEKLEKKRLTLLEEMKQVVAENIPIPPKEEQATETPSKEIESYRITLQRSLESPEMKSLKMAVIGVGQCGGRIAEQFFKFGYEAVAINTAQQDLAFLDLPDERKLILPYALGGAGKDLLVGQKAAAENAPLIKKHLEKFFSGIDQVVVCTSGGGGTGAGSLIPLLQVIGDVESLSGLPIVMIFTLPMNDEGAQAKSNAVKTLDRIAKIANDDIISSIVIIDNAKIQERYPEVSIKDFWKLANFDTVNLFNMFNTVSKCATQFDALDPMDFANILSTGGCLIYGRSEVEATEVDGVLSLDQTFLGRALIESASEGTLAEGFDVSQARRVGVIITGSEKVLSQVPAIHVNYAFQQLSDHIGDDCTIYKGIYSDENAGNVISVYTIFAGLGLPTERVLRLKQEAEEALAKTQIKQKVKLVLDEKQVLSKPDPYQEMRGKNTAMGRMIDKKRIR